MKNALRSALQRVDRLARHERLRDARNALKRLVGKSGPATTAPKRPSRVADDVHLYFSAPPTPERTRLVADAGRVIDGSFVNPAGTRPYRLYVARRAAAFADGPPLLVMLHGCKQNPADFAAGTRMDEHAEKKGWLVLYPGQPSSANRSSCWNWHQGADQRRGAGEPSIIAGMTREVMARYGVDPRRVYVAGLSAGGAMAATMADAYPDLYAACGVHSGLPHAAAHDLMSALVAMHHGPSVLRAASPAALAAEFGNAFARALQDATDTAAPRPAAPLPDATVAAMAATAVEAEAAIEAAERAVPTIVFHGDRDTVVHPGNGDCVIAQARTRAERLATTAGSKAPARAATAGATAEATEATAVVPLAGLVAVLARKVAAAARPRARSPEVDDAPESGRVPGGHGYTRTIHRDAAGRPIGEHWVVHGAGHAWSGGNEAGSFTDPLGPDASREMLRFFAAHAQPAKH